MIYNIRRSNTNPTTNHIQQKEYIKMELLSWESNIYSNKKVIPSFYRVVHITTECFKAVHRNNWTTGPLDQITTECGPQEHLSFKAVHRNKWVYHQNSLVHITTGCALQRQPSTSGYHGCAWLYHQHTLVHNTTECGPQQHLAQWCT